MTRTSETNKAPERQDSSDDDYSSDEEGAIVVEGIRIPPPPVPYCNIEVKGPRLIITHIENNFFKSYANRVTLGPFHKCFNAIIGPNGSGKSNIIDSMLFVFGYRANKIRSKKLSALLHNSKSYQNVQSCTVEVHFCLIVDKTDEEYEEVPNSRFMVSRTAHKDNSSYYTINNRRVHFKEVANLLKTHGIDLKYNRFLILQGEVEQISMMPPKSNDNENGMLEYLEDIIGTTRYKEPLAKLAEHVEQFNEQRTEKLNRLKIIQKEVEVLEEPMQEAVEYLKLENTISTSKNIVYQHNILAIKENSSEVIAKKEAADKEIADLDEKTAVVQEQKKKQELELAEITKNYDVMIKRKESIKKAYDTANTKHVQITTEMQQLNANRHKAKDQLKAENKRLENLEREPEVVEGKIKDCETSMEKLVPKIEQLEAEKSDLLANMKDLTKDLQAQKDVLTNELSGLMVNVTETKTAFTLAESELKLFTSDSQAEKNKLEQYKNAHEEIKSKIEQLTTETTKLNKQIPQKSQQLAQASSELPNIKQQEEKLVNEVRSKLSKVVEYKASMNASKNKNLVLDALMQEKRKGNCPGLFGRLGDLGAIDARYDVAVSTACGPLDNLVVDTLKTGQWCIDFLKRKDIGRATIIVLEKQEHLLEACNTPIRTPENAPRLFDLIRVSDERVRPAFYYALRDTLVAEDLEQGSRIAYGAQRFRVVTLKGELIELTGAMSGGGTRVLRGRMGQSVRTEASIQDIEALDQSINEQQDVIRELRDKQQRLQNEISTLQPEVKQMKHALEKMNVDLRTLQQREPVAAAQYKEQISKVKSISIDASKVKQLEAQVAAKKTAFDKASAKAQVIQEKVDDITKEISAKSQGKVQVIDKKLKELKKNSDKLKNEVVKLRVSLKTVQRDKEKCQKTITTLEDDIKAAENKLLELKSQQGEIEEDAKKFLEIIEKLTSTIEDGQTDYTEVKDAVKQLAAIENEHKSKKIELQHAANKIKEELNEAQQKIHGIRMKISELNLHQIPNEEQQQLKEYTDEELNAMNMEEIMTELQRYGVKLKAMTPNLGAITEYNDKRKVMLARSAEFDVVNTKWKHVRGHYDDLRNRRRDEFLDGFKIIRRKLKEMYQMITIGGDADFELIDSYDPFSEGVEFKVRPPRKTWKSISNLSGGEKTLSSLALVFALHYYKPSPLYVMDEIDAALDFKNVSIIGNYIKERTKDAQFIVISLRSNMFELASYLIGIFKTDDCTKSGTIDPRKFNTDSNEPAIEST